MKENYLNFVNANFCKVYFVNTGFLLPVIQSCEVGMNKFYTDAYKKCLWIEEYFFSAQYTNCFLAFI